MAQARTCSNRTIRTARCWFAMINGGASKPLARPPAPKRIVDIVNGSQQRCPRPGPAGWARPEQQLPARRCHPGQGWLRRPDLLPEAPYMLSANVAALIINEQEKPMDDVNFRKALAYAIDMNDIVQNDYTGLVKAADPDRPAADLGQIRRQGHGCEIRSGPMIPPRPSRSWPMPATKTSTATNSSKPRWLQDRAEDHLPERLDGLDGCHSDHLQERPGRRHQRHARLSGLRRAGATPS